MLKTRYLYLASLLFVLLWPSKQASTQEDPVWTLRFYAHESREVITVTPDGIVESMVLPDSMPEPDRPRIIDSMRLSPNGRYFAYLTDYELFIYDFINETEVAYPSLDFVEGSIGFEIGDFSPNSQQFVVGFIVHNTVESRSGERMAQDRGGLMTFEIGNSDSPTAWIVSGIDDWFPYQTRWVDTNRVVFFGSGNHYEPSPRWFERVWIPGELETLTTTDVNGLDGQTQVLPNREVAVSRNDFSYPHSGQLGMFGYFPNVIVYYNDRGHYQENINPTVIFVADDAGTMPDFHWIASGRGILIHTDPLNILTRDGILQSLEHSAEVSTFVTTEGWLVQDNDDLVHYVLGDENTIEATEIGTISGELTLLRSSPITDIPEDTFTAIGSYDWGPPHCDNDIPSTIGVGKYAAVLTDVQLYSTTDETRIGIAVVDANTRGLVVLDGPECIDGVPWWEVNTYANDGEFIGWMPEFSETGERWLEQRGPAYEETINIIREREADGYHPTGRPDFACEGFFLPVRLSVGDTAYVAEGAPNNVRSGPATDAELVGQIPGGEAFEVVGGPARQNDVVWWEVEYEGVTGWTGEGIRNIYWTQPEPPGEESTPTAESTQIAQCPGFLPSRLTVGQTGRVTPGAANNVCAQPMSSSKLVGQIPGGESFMVLAGPTCQDNTAWWQVDYNGLIGWTQEGQGDTYWLEP